MSTLDAAYWTGRDYPGGIEALAARLGKPNLSDELNPRRSGAKLGLATAVDMQAMSGDYRILYAMAAALGHYPPVPRPEVLEGEPGPCLRTLGEVMKACADVVATVSADAADGDISANDLARARREAGELVAKVQQLLGELALAHERSKASALAAGVSF